MIEKGRENHFEELLHGNWEEEQNLAPRSELTSLCPSALEANKEQQEKAQADKQITEAEEQTH